MSTANHDSHVSRRAALASLGPSGLGSARAATGAHAAAQATPEDMAKHPIVGAWMVDLVPNVATDSPTVLVFVAGGGVIDPVRGTGGAWQATGPRSAAWTIVGIADQASGTSIVVRATADVDASGGKYVASSAITLVAPDGTVVGSFPNVAHGVRVPIEPVKNGGTALPGYPIWAPTPPATPTS